MLCFYKLTPVQTIICSLAQFIKLVIIFGIIHSPCNIQQDLSDCNHYQENEEISNGGQLSCWMPASEKANVISIKVKIHFKTQLILPL